MGRAWNLNILDRFGRTLGVLRRLLEGKQDEHARSPWVSESLEKVLAMWPKEEPSAEVVFAHLRRIYRFGFRLSLDSNELRLRLFFADGELYRPEGYSRDSEALRADLAHFSDEKKMLRVGQCRMAPAKPVLKSLGFPDFDSHEAFAIQFVGLSSERWIFIDSRPELFRRKTATEIAAKLASTTASKKEVSFEREGPQP